jgi:FG-GAP-like repeat
MKKTFMNQPFRRLLHRWFGAALARTCYGSRKQRPRFVRPLLQQLEDRLVPTGPAEVSSVVTSGLGITAGTGDLRAGQTVQLTVNFDRPIQINTTNGFPTLPLNDHGTGAYSGTSGTTALTFLYTVAAGQNTSDLTVTALLLNGSAITLPGSPTNADLSGAATNPAGILQIDTQAPTVTSFTLLGSANQNDGSVVQYAIAFSEPVTGVDTSQFSVTTSGVAGASVTSVTPGVDAAHYTVNVASGNVDSGTGVGTVTLNLTGDNIKDPAGNGLGGGSFSAAPGSPIALATPPFSENPVAVVIADVNNDGFPDIVTADAQGKVSVLLGSSSGGFSAAPGSPYSLGASPLSMAIADINGDGIPDIVTGNGVGGTITQLSVLLGKGNGSFTAVTNSPFFLGVNPHAVAIADVNGDGKPDVVTGNGGIVGVYGENASVLLGSGNGTFSNAPGSPYPVGANPRSVAVADLGNGFPDLVIANEDNNTVSVLLGNGSGSFSNAPGSPFAVGTKPTSVAVADVNGDGKPDIVTANSGSNNVSVLLGNGSGSFSAAPGSPLAVGTNPASVAVADVNGDGRLDIVTANSGSNNVSVLLGNGSGSFSAAPGSPFAVGANPVSVAVADVNGDGRPDIVTANQGSSNVSVLLNHFVQVGPSFTLHDTTPPTAGSANDGTGADIDFQPYTTSIAANWTGFSDAGSRIANYQWAIGTTPGGSDVQAFTSVGTRTSAMNSLLNLTEGATYYVSVKATDNSGNSRVFSTNGVTIVPAASYLKKNTGTFTDSDGDKYTVTLSPSNVGQIAVVQTATPKGPIKQIVLQNTDPATSVLTITVVKAAGTGDGLVSIGNIEVLGGAATPLGLGGLKSIVAANCDLSGSLTLGGTATQSTSITLHSIKNGASITSGGKIGTLTAASVGTASIVAASLGTLSVAGDFAANVTLTGQGVAANQLALTQANIRGTVNGATFNVEGSVGSFTAGAFVNSQLLVDLSSFNFKINSFQVNGISGSNTPAFVNSNVQAYAVVSVNLKSVQTNNNGVKFGILVHSPSGSVTVGSPAFTFNPALNTPQGIGDFQVLDDSRSFA